MTEPARTLRRRRTSAGRLAILAAACALLAACATGSYAPTRIVVGDPQERVVAEMGPPSATYTMPDGHVRLEYNHMPAGLHTYMIDLDANGRVARWEQVLDEAHFNAIQPGMSKGDVLSLIGHPSELGRYTRPVEGETWTYRFETPLRCTVFQLAFDLDTGVTHDGGFYPPDPRCGWIRA